MKYRVAVRMVQTEYIKVEVEEAVSKDHVLYHGLGVKEGKIERCF